MAPIRTNIQEAGAIAPEVVVILQSVSTKMITSTEVIPNIEAKVEATQLIIRIGDIKARAETEAIPVTKSAGTEAEVAATRQRRSTGIEVEVAVIHPVKSTNIEVEVAVIRRVGAAKSIIITTKKRNLVARTSTIRRRRRKRSHDCKRKWSSSKKKWKRTTGNCGTIFRNSATVPRCFISWVFA